MSRTISKTVKPGKLNYVVDVYDRRGFVAGLIQRSATGRDQWLTLQTGPSTHCYAMIDGKRVDLPDGATLCAYSDN